MKTNKHSFASRLITRTVLTTSIIFLATVSVIIFKGGPVMYDRAVEYSGQCLRASLLDVQTKISTIEATASATVSTFEEHYNGNHIIDTAACYNLLRKTIENNTGIIGCGFFFEPHKYIRGNRFAGLYSTTALSGKNGEISTEWDDDISFAEDGYDYSEQEWYSLARESGEPTWISPFLEYIVTTDYQTLVSSYSYPVKDKNGDFIGIFAVDISLDWLYDKLVGIRPYEHSNVVLADNELNFICNPLSQNPYEGSMYDTPFVQEMDYTLDRSLTVNDLYFYEENIGVTKISEGHDKAFLIFQKMENGWILCTASLYDDIFSDLIGLILLISTITVICLILMFILSRRVIHKVSEPIREFAEATSKITEGRFDVPIPQVNTKDELEELGNALIYMQESVTDYIARLKTTTAEKERLASELSVARGIQSKMLNTEFPEMEHAGLSASCIPAREVGGDLYDFFIDGKYLYFIVGDVSGKGVPAALLMAITISAFRALNKKLHTMAEMTGLINNTFCRSNREMMFVTTIVGRLDTKTGELEICNGGHNPMMIVSPDGNASLYNAKHKNLACGIMEDFPYEGESLTLEKGSRLIVYTDGISEAEKADKSQYGEPRLLEWGETCGPDESDADAIDSLISSVDTFTEDNEPNDDRTILCISLKG